ncbi:MAG: hypothetical protein COA69_04150 [Robiginitomaculum sp.]|nr:MAG: hypothetical protein COA69_04150 [Robiginitomaculum sp.]
MFVSKILSRVSFAVFATFAIFGPISNTAIAAAPNIDIYAQLPRTASVRVSPDGKYIAMLAPYRGDKAVFVYNLQNPSANTVIITPPKDSIVKAIDWASSKHVIMVARIRDKGAGKMKRYSTLYSRWVSTNVETQKSVILMNDKLMEKSYPITSAGAYLHSLPDDPDYVLMALAEFGIKPEQRHYRVNLNTGKERLKRLLPISTQNIAFSSDGEKILAREDYNRRNGVYKVFHGAGKKETVVYQSKFDKTKNRTTYFITVFDGKILMQEDENEELTLFTIDPASKTRAPFTINANIGSGHVYRPIFDTITDELIGISYTDDIPKQVFSAEPYKTWHRKAKKALKGNEVRILSRTKDNAKVTLYAQSASNPGTFYLFEPKEGKISYLGGSYPEIDPSQIAQTVRFDFTARDGVEIPAYITFPPGKTKASGPMPMVVLPHGGPSARDTASFDFWAQYLAAKGYVVFKPQFRGSTGFGYDLREKGYGEFGDKMLTDTIDGVRHLISKNIAIADKICVTGASYGGYQALALPMVEPDMFKCALSVNGVSQIRDILKYEVARTGNNSSAIKFWRRIIGDRFDDKDMLIAQSPAENVAKIKAEIVLVHGTDDMTVPLKQSKTMAKALKKAGRSGDIILLPNDDHNLSLPQSRKKMLEASDALFAKHLD